MSSTLIETPVETSETVVHAPDMAKAKIVAAVGAGPSLHGQVVVDMPCTCGDVECRYSGSVYGNETYRY
jgi:hypothetical protein